MSHYHKLQFDGEIEQIIIDDRGSLISGTHGHGVFDVDVCFYNRHVQDTRSMFFLEKKGQGKDMLIML